MGTTQLPGSIRLGVRSASGQTVWTKQGTAYWFGPGGSSGATPANTPEKWNVLGVSGVGGKAGSSLVVEVTASSSQTLNTTDTFWNLPVVVNGAVQYLQSPTTTAAMANDNFVVDQALAATALVAGVPTIVAVIRAKEGVNFNVGGDRVFVSFQY
jgi:hypothetical protein